MVRKERIHTWTAVCTLLSTPVHSKASFRAPPAASLMSCACSFAVVPRLIKTVWTPGTSFLAKSRRLWKRSVMTMGSAPAARAESREMRPIGPAPLWTRSVRLFDAPHGEITRQGRDLRVGVRSVRCPQVRRRAARTESLLRMKHYREDGGATEPGEGASGSMYLTNSG